MTLRCRSCLSVGTGRAEVPLVGVPSYSFRPVSAPIVFERRAGVGCCNLFVVGGMLRGFVQWGIHEAPLAHHFTQMPDSSDKGGGDAAGERPHLEIRVMEALKVPLVRSDRSVDPRVSITWAGVTKSTNCVLAELSPVFDSPLKFPLPVLPGRSTAVRDAAERDLLYPLETLRYALVQVGRTCGATVVVRCCCSLQPLLPTAAAGCCCCGRAKPPTSIL